MSQAGMPGSTRSGSGRRGARAVACLPFLLSLVLVAGAPPAGCASRAVQREVCAVFYASDDLNLYDGDPHPVTVYLYALETSEAFERAAVADLLEGELPPGVLQPPVPITLEPGEKRSVEATFPATTHYVGVLADYDRVPGEDEGTRTQVVPARCGLRKPRLTLTSRHLYLR